MAIGKTKARSSTKRAALEAKALQEACRVHGRRFRRRLYELGNHQWGIPELRDLLAMEAAA